MRKVNLRMVPCTTFVFALLFVVFTIKAFAQAFQPSQILSHPDSYDGKRLTVSGTVRNVFPQTTRQGKDYTTFDLCNDTACVKVFVWGHLKLLEGQRQSASGRFETVKHVEPYNFVNVLEVQSIR
jgi:hypothetical protein